MRVHILLHSKNFFWAFSVIPGWPVEPWTGCGGVVRARGLPRQRPRARGHVAAALGSVSGPTWPAPGPSHHPARSRPSSRRWRAPLGLGQCHQLGDQPRARGEALPWIIVFTFIHTPWWVFLCTRAWRSTSWPNCSTTCLVPPLRMPLPPWRSWRRLYSCNNLLSPITWIYPRSCKRRHHG